jgi:hypothetical protein
MANTFNLDEMWKNLEDANKEIPVPKNCPFQFEPPKEEQVSNLNDVKPVEFSNLKNAKIETIDVDEKELSEQVGYYIQVTQKGIRIKEIKFIEWLNPYAQIVVENGYKKVVAKQTIVKGSSVMYGFPGLFIEDKCGSKSKRDKQIRKLISKNGGSDVESQTILLLDAVNKLVVSALLRQDKEEKHKWWESAWLKELYPREISNDVSEKVKNVSKDAMTEEEGKFYMKHFDKIKMNAFMHSPNSMHGKTFKN